MTKPPEILKTDVLILGSGLAGMLLALELAQMNFRIILATKGLLEDSNTSWAQGGMAAVTPSGLLDSKQFHLQDTINSGAGLTDESIASMIIDGGADLITKLCKLGVQFDTKHQGMFDLALEGGHSKARVLHRKDTTGQAISGTLITAVRQSPQIQVIENSIGIDLIVTDKRCAGAWLLIDGTPRPVVARAVALATGGLGQIFQRTTNPLVATGDGIAMAYRAGARLVDMEFVQFHPTALCLPKAPAFLISEATRGAGAHIIDNKGERFLLRFDPRGELATRDIVARAIASVMHAQGLANVWLDLRPIGAKLESRFPNIVNNLRDFGINPLIQPVAVAPAAHYFMGGIWTDASGMTSLKGLVAIGECAAVGLHGANRLASNSLLEAGVMAIRASQAISREPVDRVEPVITPISPLAIPLDLHRLRQSTYELAGLQRDEVGLKALIRQCSENRTMSAPDTRHACESASILLLSELIAKSALARQESRGSHYRNDFPQRNDTIFSKHYCLDKEKGYWLPLPRPIPSNQAETCLIA